MKKKRILHLITGLGVGGAEMMLLKTLPRMQDEFENQVCCLMGRGPIGAKLEAAGVPVVYLMLRSPLDLGVIFRFRKAVRAFQPDLLVTYLIHADLFGRIFGRLFGIRKVICSQRGSLLQWEFLRTFDRWTKGLVTAYIVQTETAQHELMQKLRLPKEKFHIIPNAIDLAEFDFPLDEAAKKQTLGIPSDHTVITCVSNLRRGKGHEFLLEAFETVFQKNPKTTLLIVGDGERRDELTSLVSGYASKPNIKFLGHRTDTREILRITDIFVLPTLAEGMSNAIMEAMATSLPIITTDIPENRALIQHQQTGMLIPQKNAIALSKALKKFLNNETARHLLGTSAKKSIQERFGSEIVLRMFRKLYRSS